MLDHLDEIKLDEGSTDGEPSDEEAAEPVSELVKETIVPEEPKAEEIVPEEDIDLLGDEDS